MDMGLMEHLGDAFFDDDFLPSPEDPFDPSIVKRELQVPDPLDASISRPNSTSITNNTNNTNNNDNNPPGIKTATLADNASGKATANPTIDTASKHDPTHTKHSPSMTATTTTSTSTTSHEHDHDRRHSTERVSNLNENDNENDDDNETPSDLLVFKSSKSHLRSSTSSSAPRPMSTEVLAPIPDLSDPAACLPSSFVDGDDEEEDDDDDVTSSPLQENRRPRHHHNVGYQQPAGGSAHVAGVSSNYALQQQNYSFMHPSAHGNVTPNNSSSTVGNAVLNCAYTNANGTSSTRTGHTAQVNASGGMNGTENMGNICRPSTLDNSNNNISSFTNTNANNLFSHSQLPTTEMDTFTFPTLSTNSTPHQNARQQPHYQAHSFPQQLFSNANSSTPSTTPRKEARSCMDGGNLPTVTTPVSAKDKLAQRKLRNKESARRYREKQVARRRHLEHYTRTLSEQNRELENLHDRLLSLTCTPIPSAVVDIDVNVISNAVPQPPQLASSSSYQHPHQQQQQQPHHQSGNFGCNEQSFIFQQQQQNQQHNHSHQHQQQHQRQNHQFSSAPSVCTPNSNTTTPGGPHHSYLGSANGPMCQQNLFNS